MQTGVKSRGCENRMAHESPIQSWNLMGRAVDSAEKSMRHAGVTADDLHTVADAFRGDLDDLASDEVTEANDRISEYFSTECNISHSMAKPLIKRMPETFSWHRRLMSPFGDHTLATTALRHPERSLA